MSGTEEQRKSGNRTASDLRYRWQEGRHKRIAAATEAIAILGGVRKTAELLSPVLEKKIGRKIRYQTVLTWKHKGIPVHFVLLVSRASGVDPYRMCPWGWWG